MLAAETARCVHRRGGPYRLRAACSERSNSQRELAFELSERKESRLLGQHLQGGGDDFGAVDFLAAFPRRGGASDASVDREHAHVLEDRPREHVLQTARTRFRREDDIHAIAGIDESGVARAGAKADSHGPRAGLEHSREKSSLARPDQRPPSHRCGVGERLAHDIAVRHLGRVRAVQENVAAADRILFNPEFRQVLLSEQGADRQVAGGRKHHAKLRLLDGRQLRLGGNGGRSLDPLGLADGQHVVHHEHAGDHGNDA